MFSTIQTIQRSLGIDRGPLGADRGPVGTDGDGLPGTYRQWRGAMSREFGGDVPSLGLIVGAGYAATTSASGKLEDDLRRTLSRTMTGAEGSKGGFTLASGMSEDVFDRARMTLGPWSFVQWVPMPTRTYSIPVVDESSCARGSRWGGFTSSWATGETAMPPSTVGTVGSRELTAKRLVALTTVSADLIADSRRCDLWLEYLGVAELRQAIEDALIWGPSSYLGSPAVGPEGVLTAKSTVTVAADSLQSAGTITATNLHSMWQAIAPGNRAGAAWYASAETSDAIDQLAVSGTFPLSLYLPAGMNAFWPFASIKGRPLIPCEACPAIGTPGDICCVDFGDYVFGYLKPSPLAGPLGFGFSAPADQRHRGLIGIPDGSVDRRLIDGGSPALFENNMVALSWKFRGDGAFIWTSTVTSPTGVTQGPASIIAAR